MTFSIDKLASAIPNVVDKIPVLGTLYHYTAAVYDAVRGDARDTTIQVVDGFQGIIRDFTFWAEPAFVGVAHAATEETVDGIIKSLFDDDQRAKVVAKIQAHKRAGKFIPHYSRYMLVTDGFKEKLESKKDSITSLRMLRHAIWAGKWRYKGDYQRSCTLVLPNGVAESALGVFIYSLGHEAFEAVAAPSVSGQIRNAKYDDDGFSFELDTSITAPTGGYSFKGTIGIKTGKLALTIIPTSGAPSMEINPSMRYFNRMHPDQKSFDQIWTP
ncbi:hypothetical protein HUA76_30945 [Myxococcus sp. CA056]|uniref:hypothetical protein n=1 Tax=Myxococcus sp. CA056 TaxID=2741740 RepID=UPI00157B418B|nr:hypothetical protein [Myxococcus sp. CA056]NTX15212.1 hypothetical protein [Myxococcus sp. CA056]